MSILNKHKLWLEGKEGGERADLRGYSLSNLDLEGVDLRNADLSYADLSYTNLRGANLSGANLSNANLTNTDLAGADLRRANLNWTKLVVADLREAVLYRTGLRNADLRGADLRGLDLAKASFNDCIGNGKEVKSLRLHRYNVSYGCGILNIGCETHSYEEWRDFTDEEISKMADDALKWWREYKPIIMMLIDKEKGDDDESLH